MSKSNNAFRESKWKWVALFLGCFIMFGHSYSYDMPNSAYSKLKEKVTHDGNSEVNYNLLYSVLSYPNVVLPLLGGILVDKLGLNLGIILFAFFTMFGQSVFSFA